MVAVPDNRTLTLQRPVLTTCSTPRPMFVAAGQKLALTASNKVRCSAAGTQSAKILLSALIIGILGGLAHEVASIILKKVNVDDPLDAFAVHGAGGMMGLLLRPLLDRTGPKGEMFGWHVVGILVICAWSGGISAIVFGLLKVCKQLRISVSDEMMGEDRMAQKMYNGEKQ